MSDLDRLIEAVTANPKYRAIHPDLIRRVGEQELARGRGFKEAVKAVRNKLHQVGGAYQEQSMDYPAWRSELSALPREADSPPVRDFCRKVMARHASTRERLPFLDRFYADTLASLAPIHSLLDVACGLNPLALAWMPLAAGAQYHACDIYQDMLDFLNAFFDHVGVNGHADPCDLTADMPGQPVQAALALKTIPCLEQLDKAVAPRLLDGLKAPNLLVSFPARSLGGRSKGMPDFYEGHFRDLLGNRPVAVEKFAFPSEIAFLVRRIESRE